MREKNSPVWMAMKERLSRLFKGIGDFQIKPAETTLFSIGGRGHWENPTSDLLRFFMVPSEAHDLGSLFLKAFLECLGEPAESSELLMTDVQVFREYPTSRGRIDLLVVCEHWILAIENKIRAPLQNDLEEYKCHVGRFGKPTALLAVLAPQHVEITAEGWVSVTYQTFLEKLKAGMAIYSAHQVQPSKWIVFANELISHLSQELYPQQTVMTADQFHFTETNLLMIDEARKLASLYTASLLEKIKGTLNTATPRYCWNVWDDGWCLKGKCAELKCEIMFQSPVHSGGNTKPPHFRIGAWLTGTTADMEEKLRTQFPSGWSATKNSVDWDVPNLPDSEAAIIRLGNLVKALNELDLA